jgi:hypothetical protein
MRDGWQAYAMTTNADLPTQLLERFQQCLESPFGTKRLTTALGEAAPLIEAARRCGATWVQIADTLSVALARTESSKRLDEATLRGLMRRIARRQARNTKASFTGPRIPLPVVQSQPHPDQLAQPMSRSIKSSKNEARSITARATPADQRTKAERLAASFDQLRRIR